MIYSLLSVPYQDLDVISHYAYLKSILITGREILYTANNPRNPEVLKIPSLD